MYQNIIHITIHRQISKILKLYPTFSISMVNIIKCTYSNNIQGHKNHGTPDPHLAQCPRYHIRPTTTATTRLRTSDTSMLMPRLILLRIRSSCNRKWPSCIGMCPWVQGEDSSIWQSRSSSWAVLNVKLLG